MPVGRALGKRSSPGLSQPAPFCYLQGVSLEGWGAHHNLGEDVPGVLAFSMQPQRTQCLLQPRWRARPRGPLQESWGGALARGDVVGDWGARRL